MSAGVHQRVRGHVLAVPSWPLWTLPRWLVCFVLAVMAAYVAAVAVAASRTSLEPRDLMLFGLLLACSAASVELTRRAGETAGLTKDVFGVWELPIALLLPPDGAPAQGALKPVDHRPGQADRPPDSCGAATHPDRSEPHEPGPGTCRFWPRRGLSSAPAFATHGRSPSHSSAAHASPGSCAWHVSRSPEPCRPDA